MADKQVWIKYRGIMSAGSHMEWEFKQVYESGLQEDRDEFINEYLTNETDNWIGISDYEWSVVDLPPKSYLEKKVAYHLREANRHTEEMLSYKRMLLKAVD